LTGPGLLHAQASYHEAVRKLPADANISATLAVSPAGSELATEILFHLLARGEQADYKRSWEAEE
jgi:hypothetical protein